MSISNVYSSPYITTDQAPSLRNLGESHGTTVREKTDWKIRSLVVMSNLLVILGLMLAASSLYFSTTLHPLLTSMASAFPIAGGIGIKAFFDPNFKGIPFIGGDRVPHVDPIPLVGLHNDSHNCWANAAMQLLFNAPTIRKRLEEIDAQWPSLKGIFVSHPLRPLLKEFGLYKKDQEDRINGSTNSISRANSQNIRKWMVGQFPKRFSKNSNVPEDMCYLLNYVIRHLGLGLPPSNEMTINTKEGEVVDATHGKHSKDENAHMVDLSMTLGSNCTTTQQAFEQHFRSVVELPSGGTRELVRGYKYPPEDLFVCIGAAAEVENTTRPDLYVNPTLNADASQMGEKASYTCDSFTYHDGKTIFAGHWRACLLKDGIWFECSDQFISPLSQTSVDERLQKANYVHYRKDA